MRLAVGALGNISKTGGGATVIYNLLRALRDRFPSDEYYVIVSRTGEDHLKNLESKNLHLIRLLWGSNPVSSTLVEQMVLPQVLRSLNVDAAFFPNSTYPILTSTPTLLMVQARMFHFEQLDTLRKKLKNLIIMQSLRHAPLMITASESHRQDLVNNLGLLQNKVRVVPLGVNWEYIQETSKREDRDSFLKNLGITKPYVLFVSVLRPYKNLEVAISAFASLLSHYHYDMQLVVTGDFEYAYRGAFQYKTMILESVHRFHLEDRVLLVGNRDSEEIYRLFGGASVFLFPSRFEGFGLPLLEAMAAGVPVLASNVYSIPEVTRDAAILLDPDDVEGFAMAMHRILSSRAERSLLIAKGYDLVQRYSWQNTAVQVRALLEELIKHKSS